MKNDLKISKFALVLGHLLVESFGVIKMIKLYFNVRECYENESIFDTAPGYGDGRSEEVLGKAIKILETQCDWNKDSSRTWKK